MKFWSWPWQLRNAGVLGINARNLFINSVNPRSLYPRVDNKVITKTLCDDLGIPCPKTYSVISRLGDIPNLKNVFEQQQDFVVKPANGSGGRGIMVIAQHNNEEFFTPGNEKFTYAEIKYRIATILSGLYSLGGKIDSVIIEERIKPHTIFGNLAVSGTPDIRVIVNNNKSIMAMLRLPTKLSRGRANLHQGAVGVGIDIKKGCTHGGVFRGRRVLEHPDTGYNMQNIAIDHWDKIIEIAEKLSKAIGLGYLGVDIVLDVNRGPLVLEANARPGLAIQLANNLGIKNFLKGL